MFSGTNGKLVAIACSLFLFQQFSGINAIVYFSSSVFKDAGVGSETLASAAVGLVNVLGTVVAASLMDKAGRKCASALLVSPTRLFVRLPLPALAVDNACSDHAPCPPFAWLIPANQIVIMP
jgi:MFS family permease